MARPCPVCAHPDRAAIDSAILNGKALRAIARDFQVTSSTGVPDHHKVQRHRDTCLPDAYQAAVQANKTAHGAAIAARLRVLDEAVDEVLNRARQGRVVLDGEGLPVLDAQGTGDYLRVHDDRTVLAAVREARANAETLAKLSGAVPEQDQEALEAAREAQKNPQVRALLAEAERIMAQAGGH